MSNFTSNNYNYYSSVNSNNNEELSKKMKGNSLITYKSSFNVLPNDEKSNWMSIINNMNEVEKAKNDTPDLIEDLNYKKTKSIKKYL